MKKKKRSSVAEFVAVGGGVAVAVGVDVGDYA